MYQKRHRTTFNQYQLNLLEEAFKQNSYPSSTFRDALAAETNLDSSRIQVWFQNRRAKYKKQYYQAVRLVANTTATVAATHHQSQHPLNQHLKAHHSLSQHLANQQLAAATTDSAVCSLVAPQRVQLASSHSANPNTQSHQLISAATGPSSQSAQLAGDHLPQHQQLQSAQQLQHQHSQHSSSIAASISSAASSYLSSFDQCAAAAATLHQQVVGHSALSQNQGRGSEPSSPSESPFQQLMQQQPAATTLVITPPTAHIKPEPQQIFQHFQLQNHHHNLQQQQQPQALYSSSSSSSCQH